MPVEQHVFADDGEIVAHGVVAAQPAEGDPRRRSLVHDDVAGDVDALARVVGPSPSLARLSIDHVLVLIFDDHGHGSVVVAKRAVGMNARHERQILVARLILAK